MASPQFQDWTILAGDFDRLANAVPAANCVERLQWLETKAGRLLIALQAEGRTPAGVQFRGSAADWQAMQFDRSTVEKQHPTGLWIGPSPAYGPTAGLTDRAVWLVAVRRLVKAVPQTHPLAQEMGRLGNPSTLDEHDNWLTPDGAVAWASLHAEVCRQLASPESWESTPTLTGARREVLHMLQALPAGEGMTAPEILSELKKSPNTAVWISEESSIRRIAKALKPFGVQNTGKSGYYFDPATAQHHT